MEDAGYACPDLTLGFSPHDRTLFIQELSAAARDCKTSLGSTSGQADEINNQLEALFDKLGSESAEFSPVLDVAPLTNALFSKHSLEPPSDIARFDFYLLTIPVTLLPKSGWAFRQLECNLCFNADASDQQRPVAHEIFPTSEWIEVFRASQTLSVGLDENLQFKLAPSSFGGGPRLSDAVQAQVELKSGVKSTLILGPFNYTIRRPKIVAVGKGNVWVSWRLDGEEYFEREVPRFGVVLKVPKSIRRIDVLGTLRAERDFHFFTADIRYLLKYVREKTRRFWEQGAPVVDKRMWTNITAPL